MKKPKKIKPEHGEFYWVEFSDDYPLVPDEERVQVARFFLAANPHYYNKWTICGNNFNDCGGVKVLAHIPCPKKKRKS